MRNRIHKLDADAVCLFQSVQLQLEEDYPPAVAAQIRHILSAAVSNCAISDNDIVELQRLFLQIRPKQGEPAGKSVKEDASLDCWSGDLSVQEKGARDRLYELEKSGERMFRQMVLHSKPERRKLKSLLKRLQGNCQKKECSRFK